MKMHNTKTDDNVQQQQQARARSPSPVMASTSKAAATAAAAAVETAAANNLTERTNIEAVQAMALNADVNIDASTIVANRIRNIQVIDCKKLKKSGLDIELARCLLKNKSATMVKALARTSDKVPPAEPTLTTISSPQIKVENTPQITEQKPMQSLKLNIKKEQSPAENKELVTLSPSTAIDKSSQNIEQQATATATGAQQSFHGEVPTEITVNTPPKASLTPLPLSPAANPKRKPAPKRSTVPMPSTPTAIPTATPPQPAEESPLSTQGTTSQGIPAPPVPPFTLSPSTSPTNLQIRSPEELEAICRLQYVKQILNQHLVEREASKRKALAEEMKIQLKAAAVAAAAVPCVASTQSMVTTVSTTTSPATPAPQTTSTKEHKGYLILKPPAVECNPQKKQRGQYVKLKSPAAETSPLPPTTFHAQNVHILSQQTPKQQPPPVAQPPQAPQPVKHQQLQPVKQQQQQPQQLEQSHDQGYLKFLERNAIIQRNQAIRRATTTSANSSPGSAPSTPGSAQSVTPQIIINTTTPVRSFPVSTPTHSLNKNASPGPRAHAAKKIPTQTEHTPLSSRHATSGRSLSSSRTPTPTRPISNKGHTPAPVKPATPIRLFPNEQISTGNYPAYQFSSDEETIPQMQFVKHTVTPPPPPQIDYERTLPTAAFQRNSFDIPTTVKERRLTPSRKNIPPSTTTSPVVIAALSPASSAAPTTHAPITPTTSHAQSGAQDYFPISSTGGIKRTVLNTEKLRLDPKNLKEIASKIRSQISVDSKIQLHTTLKYVRSQLAAADAEYYNSLHNEETSERTPQSPIRVEQTSQIPIRVGQTAQTPIRVEQIPANTVNIGQRRSIQDAAGGMRIQTNANAKPSPNVPPTATVYRLPTVGNHLTLQTPNYQHQQPAVTAYQQSTTSHATTQTTTTTASVKRIRIGDKPQGLGQSTTAAPKKVIAIRTLTNSIPGGELKPPSTETPTSCSIGKPATLVVAEKCSPPKPASDTVFKVPPPPPPPKTTNTVVNIFKMPPVPPAQKSSSKKSNKTAEKTKSIPVRRNAISKASTSLTHSAKKKAAHKRAALAAVIQMKSTADAIPAKTIPTATTTPAATKVSPFARAATRTIGINTVASVGNVTALVGAATGRQRVVSQRGPEIIKVINPKHVPVLTTAAAAATSTATTTTSTTAVATQTALSLQTACAETTTNSTQTMPNTIIIVSADKAAAAHSNPSVITPPKLLQRPLSVTSSMGTTNTTRVDEVSGIEKSKATGARISVGDRKLAGGISIGERYTVSENKTVGYRTIIATKNTVSERNAAGASNNVVVERTIVGNKATTVGDKYKIIERSAAADRNSNADRSCSAQGAVDAKHAIMANKNSPTPIVTINRSPPKAFTIKDTPPTGANIPAQNENRGATIIRSRSQPSPDRGSLSVTAKTVTANGGMASRSDTAAHGGNRVESEEKTTTDGGTVAGATAAQGKSKAKLRPKPLPVLAFISSAAKANAKDGTSDSTVTCRGPKVYNNKPKETTSTAGAQNKPKPTPILISNDRTFTKTSTVSTPTSTTSTTTTITTTTRKMKAPSKSPSQSKSASMHVPQPTDKTSNSSTNSVEIKDQSMKKPLSAVDFIASLVDEIEGEPVYELSLEEMKMAAVFDKKPLPNLSTQSPLNKAGISKPKYKLKQNNSDEAAKGTESVNQPVHTAAKQQNLEIGQIISLKEASVYSTVFDQAHPKSIYKTPPSHVAQDVKYEFILSDAIDIQLPPTETEATAMPKPRTKDEPSGAMPPLTPIQFRTPSKRATEKQGKVRRSVPVEPKISVLNVPGITAAAITQSLVLDETSPQINTEDLVKNTVSGGLDKSQKPDSIVPILEMPTIKETAHDSLEKTAQKKELNTSMICVATCTTPSLHLFGTETVGTQTQATGMDCSPKADKSIQIPVPEPANKRQRMSEQDGTVVSEMKSTDTKSTQIEGDLLEKSKEQKCAEDVITLSVGTCTTPSLHLHNTDTLSVATCTTPSLHLYDTETVATQTKSMGVDCRDKADKSIQMPATQEKDKGKSLFAEDVASIASVATCTTPTLHLQDTETVATQTKAARVSCSATEDKSSQFEAETVAATKRQSLSISPVVLNSYFDAPECPTVTESAAVTNVLAQVEQSPPKPVVSSATPNDSPKIRRSSYKKTVPPIIARINKKNSKSQKLTTNKPILLEIVDSLGKKPEEHSPPAVPFKVQSAIQSSPSTPKGINSLLKYFETPKSTRVAENEDIKERKIEETDVVMSSPCPTNSPNSSNSPISTNSPNSKNISSQKSSSNVGTPKNFKFSGSLASSNATNMASSINSTDRTNLIVPAKAQNTEVSLSQINLENLKSSPNKMDSLDDLPPAENFLDKSSAPNKINSPNSTQKDIALNVVIQGDSQCGTNSENPTNSSNSSNSTNPSSIKQSTNLLENPNTTNAEYLESSVMTEKSTFEMNSKTLTSSLNSGNISIPSNLASNATNSPNSRNAENTEKSTSSILNNAQNQPSSESSTNVENLDNSVMTDPQFEMNTETPKSLSISSNSTNFLNLPPNSTNAENTEKSSSSILNNSEIPSSPKSSTNAENLDNSVMTTEPQFEMNTETPRSLSISSNSTNLFNLPTNSTNLQNSTNAENTEKSSSSILNNSEIPSSSQSSTNVENLDNSVMTTKEPQFESNRETPSLSSNSTNAEYAETLEIPADSYYGTNTESPTSSSVLRNTQSPSTPLIAKSSQNSTNAENLDNSILTTDPQFEINTEIPTNVSISNNSTNTTSSTNSTNSPNSTNTENTGIVKIPEDSNCGTQESTTSLSILSNSQHPSDITPNSKNSQNSAKVENLEKFVMTTDNQYEINLETTTSSPNSRNILTPSNLPPNSATNSTNAENTKNLEITGDSNCASNSDHPTNSSISNNSTNSQSSTNFQNAEDLVITEDSNCGKSTGNPTASPVSGNSVSSLNSTNAENLDNSVMTTHPQLEINSKSPKSSSNLSNSPKTSAENSAIATDSMFGINAETPLKLSDSGNSPIAVSTPFAENLLNETNSVNTTNLPQPENPICFKTSPISPNPIECTDLPTEICNVSKEDAAIAATTTTDSQSDDSDRWSYDNSTIEASPDEMAIDNNSKSAKTMRKRLRKLNTQRRRTILFNGSDTEDDLAQRKVQQKDMGQGETSTSEAQHLRRQTIVTDKINVPLKKRWEPQKLKKQLFKKYGGAQKMRQPQVETDITDDTTPIEDDELEQQLQSAQSLTPKTDIFDKLKQKCGRIGGVKMARNRRNRGRRFTLPTCMRHTPALNAPTTNKMDDIEEVAEVKEIPQLPNQLKRRRASESDLGSMLLQNERAQTVAALKIDLTLPARTVEAVAALCKKSADVNAAKAKPNSLKRQRSATPTEEVTQQKLGALEKQPEKRTRQTDSPVHASTSLEALKIEISPEGQLALNSPVKAAVKRTVANNSPAIESSANDSDASCMSDVTLNISTGVGANRRRPGRPKKIAQAVKADSSEKMPLTHGTRMADGKTSRSSTPRSLSGNDSSSRTPTPTAMEPIGRHSMQITIVQQSNQTQTIPTEQQNDATNTTPVPSSEQETQTIKMEEAVPAAAAAATQSKEQATQTKKRGRKRKEQVKEETKVETMAQDEKIRKMESPMEAEHDTSQDSSILENKSVLSVVKRGRGRPPTPLGSAAKRKIVNDSPTPSTPTNTPGNVKRRVSTIPFNPRLLLIKSRRQLETAEELVSEIETSGPLQCGLCKARTSKDNWNSHLAEHYGIGWVEGVDPVPDVTKRAHVVNFINDFLKSTGIAAIKCRMCERAIRTGIGMVGHLEECGVDKTPIFCEHCNRAFIKTQIEKHRIICLTRMEEAKQRAEEEAKPTALNVSSSGRIKRASLVKAETKLKAIGELSALAVDVDPKEHINYYEPKIMLHQLTAQWTTDIAQAGQGLCATPNCNFAAATIEELTQHAASCPQLPATGYHCTICKNNNNVAVFDSEDAAVLHVIECHVKGKGRTQRNEFDGGDCSDYEPKEAESSSDECSSGVNSDAENGNGYGSCDETDVSSKKKQSKGGGLYNTNGLKREEPGKLKRLYLPRLRALDVFTQQRWNDFISRALSEQTLFDYILPNYEKSALNLERDEDGEDDEDVAAALLPKWRHSFKMHYRNQPKLPRILGAAEQLEWQEVKRFKSLEMRDDTLTYIGAPVKFVKWVPVPEHVAHDVQYLVVAYRSEQHDFTKNNEPGMHETVLLVFKVGKTENAKYCVDVQYGLRIADGPVHCIDLMPSGGYDEQLNRLGLCAVGTAHSLQIYALPLKVSDDKVANVAAEQPAERLTLFAGKPQIALKVSEQQAGSKAHILCHGQCVHVCWSETKPHNLIFAGYTNGCIGIFDIDKSRNVEGESDKEASTADNWSDNLNYHVLSDGTGVVYPLNYLYLGERYVRSIAIHYDQNGPRWLAAICFARSLICFDIEDLTLPKIVRKELPKNILNSLDWSPVWEAYLTGAGDIIPNFGRVAVGFNPMCITFGSKRVQHTLCGVNYVHYSELQNMEAYATDNGDVLLVNSREMNLDYLYNKLGKHLGRALYTLDLKCLNGEALPPFQETLKQTDYSYFREDLREHYGVVFGAMDKLTPSNAKAFMEKTRMPPNNLMQLMRANTVRWNKTEAGKCLVAVGYDNGFMRVLNFNKRTKFTPRERNEVFK